MQDKDKEFNPFAVNFKRLQQYNFGKLSIDEIILFEYFVMMPQWYNHNPFYHSSEKIYADTGIKRRQQESTIKKFTHWGIISVESKGFPKVKYFTINYGVIQNKLNVIYQFVQNDKLYVQTYKLYGVLYNQFVQKDVQEKQIVKGTKEETKLKTKEEKKKLSDLASIEALKNSFSYSIEQTKALLNTLEKEYNARREHKKPGKYPEATLSFKREVIENANKAHNELGRDFIVGAWMVFTDKLMSGEIETKRLLPYFFSIKDDSFDVINAMSDIHNTSYVFSKNE